MSLVKKDVRIRILCFCFLSRLLLWDCDDRSYSYYVEVSANQRDWDVVCDRARENCKSWQTITFPKRPVVYIKIVGTHNTANEVRSRLPFFMLSLYAFLSPFF